MIEIDPKLFGNIDKSKIEYDTKVREATDAILGFVLKSKKTALLAKKKLSLLGYEDIIINDAVTYLCDKGYIDDTKFCISYIKDAVMLRFPSKRLLEYELERNGVSQEIINNCFDELEIDDKDLVKAAADKKMRITQGITYDKLIKFLFSKGFEPEAVRSYLKENLDEEMKQR